MMEMSGRPTLRGQEVFNWLHRLELSHHFDSFLTSGFDTLIKCRQISEKDLVNCLRVTDIHERLALLQAVRLLHVTPQHRPRVHQLQQGQQQQMGQREEIELHVLKNQVLYYHQNNNAYPQYQDNPVGDYSECAEYDLTRCYCDGGGGICANCSDNYEPMYESVVVSNNTSTTSAAVNNSSGGVNNFQLLTSLKSQLRDQVRNDGINFSRIADESTLRAVAAKYAMELSNAGAPGGLNMTLSSGGGGASFSSTSSSSSGYPSSLATNGSSKSSTNSNSSSNSAPNTTLWLREGLPLLEFQQQVLQQLRELWLEERRKFLYHQHSLGGGGAIVLSPSQATAIPSINPASRTFDYGVAEPPHHNNKALEAEPTKTPKRQLQPYLHQTMGHQQGHRQAYTPGVYQPSSCLRDRDDIYDYIPPRNSAPMPKDDNDEQEGMNESPLRTPKQRGTTLSRYGGRHNYTNGKGFKTSSYGFVSPRRNISNAGRFSTLRAKSCSAVGGGGHTMKTSLSSYTISGSCSSGNSSTTTATNYGYLNHPFPNHFSHTTGGGEDGGMGCRTLVNLHKLGRRLGLTRFFRTLRIQNADGSGETTTRQYVNSTTRAVSSDRVLYGMTPASEQALARLQPLVPDDDHGENQENETSGGGSLLSSLPSNERIIETINRLKYEELQRRKERLTQQHHQILKDLKGSSRSSGTASVFYVNGNAASDNQNGANNLDEEDSGSNYEEPFDTNSKTAIKSSLPPEQFKSEEFQDLRSSQRSNESFSEIFARHLRSRVSNKSSGASSSRSSDINSGDHLNNTNNTSTVKGSLNNLPTTNTPHHLKSSGRSTTSKKGSAESLQRIGSSTWQSDVGNQRKGSSSTSSASTAEGSDANSERRRLSKHEHNESTISPPDWEYGEQRIYQVQSSEEDRISQHPSTSSSVVQCEDTTEVPLEVIGQATALVESQPSPYDRHALRFKKGDMIDVLKMGHTGLWLGRCNGQVGHFKFINVRLVTDDAHSQITKDESSHGARSLEDQRVRDKMVEIMEGDVLDSNNKEGGSPSSPPKSPRTPSIRKGRPKSVGDLLQRINLHEHISLFILHGFETLDLFKELEEEDLDRLGILGEADRAKILTAVELLREFDSDTNSSQYAPSSPGADEGDRPPAQTLYQYHYYNSRNPSKANSTHSHNDDQDDCIPTVASVEVHQHQTPSHKSTFKNPPANKSTPARDSGIFLGKDTEESELILSPQNLQNCPAPLSSPSPKSQQNGYFNSYGTRIPRDGKGLNPSTSNNTGNADQYVEVRNRFLQAKNLFETNGLPWGKSQPNYDNVDRITTKRNDQTENLSQGQNPQNSSRFLYCEKSSDSGISVCTNSPPPLRNEYRS